MKQNKIILSTLILSIAAGLTLLAVNIDQEESIETMYVPSDMSKSLPQFDGVYQGHATWSTDDVKKVKKEIKYTIRGTVVSIGELEFWTDPTPQPEELQKIRPQNVLIPINIQVDKIKHYNGEFTGEIFTVKLTGQLLDNKLYLDGGEPQFEVGEKVVVHVGIDPNDVIEKDHKYVVLGEFGKYKIQDDKAYNEKYPKGKSIDKAFKDAD